MRSLISSLKMNAAHAHLYRLMNCRTAIKLVIQNYTDSFMGTVWSVFLSLFFSNVLSLVRAPRALSLSFSLCVCVRLFDIWRLFYGGCVCVCVFVKKVNDKQFVRRFECGWSAYLYRKHRVSFIHMQAIKSGNLSMISKLLLIPAKKWNRLKIAFLRCDAD